MPRTEHEARWAATDRDIANLKSRLSEDEKLVVPRDELSGRLTNSENNFKLLSDRINELRNQTLTTVTVRDELARVQNEIIELRRLLADKKQ